MEISTIIGIVITIIVMCIAGFFTFRKPKPVEPSLETDLYINPESQQPVIPRHVRDQILNQDVVKPSIERIEPDLKVESVKAEPPVQISVPAQAVAEKELQETVQENIITEPVVAEEQLAPVVPASETSVEVSANEVLTENVDETAENAEQHKADEHKTESDLSLNPNIETVEIAEFDGESNILDVHLHEQQRYDDESALAVAEQIIALNVYPNPRRALSGDKALKVLLKYGLRFGEMSCFHRYENTDEPSALMFSVLRITDHGPAGFDLETLSAEQVQGLAFFLALPNSKAVTGYDMMTSIAGLIAREVDGKVYDENNQEFTPQLKEHWRHQVIDFKPTE